MSTRSGCSRSRMAVPSARNSGLERTAKVPPVWVVDRICWIRSAARTGIVDFSTTMVWPRACSAMRRAQASTYCKSEALPAPAPDVLVGVCTEMKTTSASAKAATPWAWARKCKLRPRTCRTISGKPGSKTGRLSLFQAAMRAALRSSTVTCTSGQRAAMTAMVGPPT